MRSTPAFSRASENPRTTTRVALVIATRPGWYVIDAGIGINAGAGCDWVRALIRSPLSAITGATVKPNAASAARVTPIGDSADRGIIPGEAREPDRSARRGPPARWRRSARPPRAHRRHRRRWP